MTESPLPSAVIEEAVRLTRLANRAATGDQSRSEEAEKYRTKRDTLLTTHDYTARVRDDPDPVVVLYPSAWVTNGTVDLDAIEDTDNAIERPLTGGEAIDYDTAATHNQAIVETVADTYDETHAANAAAFATFMNNHRTRPIETATATDITEFREEYYPRNTWPTATQQDCIHRSLRYTLEIATNH